MYTELSEKNVSWLENMSEGNLSVECADLSGQIPPVEVKGVKYRSREILYRIFIPEVYLNYKKCLYLDCDIIALDDIGKLYEIDLAEKVIGAVKNPCNEEFYQYIIQNIKIPPFDYFNSGLLLIDMEKYRRLNIAGKVLENYVESKDKYIFPDQDVLNVVCHGMIKYLPDEWNFEWHCKCDDLLEECREAYQKAEQAPRIIHFTDDKKPWANPSLPKSEYFWKYARQSPYYEEILFRNLHEFTLNQKPENSLKKWSFPFELVRRRSKIVIYAAGAVGKAFYQQIKLTGYCDIVLWVDKNYGQLPVSGLPVKRVSEISEVEYDHVVIAVESEHVATEIKGVLKGMGIPEKKMVWQDPKV